MGNSSNNFMLLKYTFYGFISKWDKHKGIFILIERELE